MQGSAIEWANLPWGFILMVGIFVVLVIVFKDLLK